MSGDLTDVPGIRVGHWTDHPARTGCTVVLLPDHGAITSAEVRGAAPGTRELDLLRPESTVQRAHAIVLTGGSAFGLAAADGVMRWLEGRSVGLATPGGPVPVVPAAVLYDLAAGAAGVRPDAVAGAAAAEAALDSSPCGAGPIGAGSGCTVGKLFGSPVDAGLGTASLVAHLERLGGSHGTCTVGAVAAVNAVGDVVAVDGTVMAGAGTVGRLLSPETEARVSTEPARDGADGDTARGAATAGEHTTLVVVATDAPLTKTQTFRLAQVSHDGLAVAIRPVHTSLDGDVVFAVSTGEGPPIDDSSFVVLQTAAVEVVADAIRASVTEVGRPHVP